ncbi:MAG: hypothetical protein KJ050_10655 [Candidatus Omnitrophica bacterium]|nr:hypothetical protein [Candidatus Omnitrophota bacterium]
MAATAQEITLLRRMANEGSDAVYSDEDITQLIESNPMPDSEGYMPDNENWEPTYDLNAAASKLWAEKAGRLATEADFSADGGSYSRSQLYDMALRQSKYYGARRYAGTLTLFRPQVRNKYSEGFLDESG